MKFKDFEKFKYTLAENGVIDESMDNNKKRELYVESYNDGIYFDIKINELSEGFDEQILESINENYSERIDEAFLFAFVKNPIATTKMINNGRKLERAKIMKAAINIDFSKKIDAVEQKFGDDAARKRKMKETLQQAKKLKEDQAKELVDNISKRITELAGSDKILGRFASYIKTTASIAANKKLFKAADGEEAKQLGLKIEQDEKKIAVDERSFKEYDAELSDEERKNAEEEAKKAKEKQEKEKTDKEKTDKETKTTDTETNTKDGNKTPKEKTEPVKDKLQQQKDKIKETIASIQNKIERIKGDIEEAESEKKDLSAAYEKAKGQKGEGEAAKELAAQSNIIKDMNKQLETEKENLDAEKLELRNLEENK